MNLFDVDDQILPEPLRGELAKRCRVDPNTRTAECSRRDYLVRKIVKHYTIPVSKWKLVSFLIAMLCVFLFLFSLVPGTFIGVIFGSVLFSVLITSCSVPILNYIAQKTIYQRQIDNTIAWFNEQTNPLKEIPGFLDWKTDDILKMNDNSHKPFMTSQYEYKGVLDDGSIVVQKLFGSGGTRGSKIPYTARLLKYNLYRNNSLEKRKKEKRECHLEKELEESDFDEIVHEVRKEMKQKV